VPKWCTRSRRGDDEIVRVFVSPERERVVVRGLAEARDRGRRKGWIRRGSADEVIGEVDVRLRRETH